MIIRTVLILIFLITGCAVSQVVTDQEESSNGTGEVMGMVYDEGSFFINPPFHLVLFNKNEYFTKRVSKFYFSFDSIPTGSYTLALIDSVKNEGFVNTDTLYDISISADSISMVAMHYNNRDDYWQPVKIQRRGRNNKGRIKGRFNVEEYERITECKFEPVKSNDPHPEDKEKYASIYLTGIDSFKTKTYTDSLGNFKFDSIPVGFYELRGSKANYCKQTTRLFDSFKTTGVIVLPDRISIVYINNINLTDALILYVPGLQSEIDMMPEPTVKWKSQFKN